jgi:hypothetical protein
MNNKISRNGNAPLMFFLHKRVWVNMQGIASLRLRSFAMTIIFPFSCFFSHRFPQIVFVAADMEVNGFLYYGLLLSL